MPITCSFETRFEIDLNWYLKGDIRHLLEGLLQGGREREKHSVCVARVFVTKFS